MLSLHFSRYATTLTMKGMKPGVSYVYVALSYRAFHVATRFSGWLAALYSQRKACAVCVYMCVIKYVL